ncbi:MAG TPA: NADH:flavin oxidoreductase [Bacteroidales bacterium]|nr:NADH:flavin oxidoreductase [Bacteroidales bacterium]
MENTVPVAPVNSALFRPGSIGPLKLRNRTLRSAAFEGMCPGHLVSRDLIDYHRSVGAGEIGMTTVAYASVSRSGLSFPHQLWLRKEAVPGLKELTEAVHGEGAAAGIQIGHCGLMAKRSVTGGYCLAPSGRFNLYGPTWPRTLKKNEIREIVLDFGEAVNLARESGFDSVEVHAGHGYLISQFLSPWTNRRKDEYGGSFENRSRFLTEVIREVMKQAGSDIAVTVKMNLRDGFRGGMEMDESLEVAKLLEKEGVHALVLSGGFVSRAPMYVMRGRMPVEVMSHYMKERWLKPFIRWFGEMLIHPEPFSEGYFLEDALKVRQAVNLPLIYVGGMISLEKMEEVLGKGFEFIQLARALVHDPMFIRKIHAGELTRSGCNHANYCIAVMYSGKMACYQNEPNIPEKWRRKLSSPAD